MERWKARARRWEFRAAQRRLERRRKTGESTPSAITDDHDVVVKGESDPKAENLNDHTEIAA
jgi:hypothetical protein